MNALKPKETKLQRIKSSKKTEGRRNKAAGRTAVRERVWVREWEGSVWTGMVCMCVSEELEAAATTAGVPWVA